MADKSSDSGSREEEGKPMKYFTYERKSRAVSDQEDKNRLISESDEDVSKDEQILNKELQGEPIKAKSAVAKDDDDDDDDSITNQILEGEAMDSLTLPGEDEIKDRFQEWLPNVPRKKRTPKKMMKLSDIYLRKLERFVKISEEEEEVISPVTPDNSEKKGSSTESLNSEQEVEDENESSLPASSPEAEDKPESLLRLFSKQLTADDTNGKVHLSLSQMEHFPLPIDLTAEFSEAGRRVTLQIVDEHGYNWKMMLTSYQEVDKTRGYCIDCGWKEFVDAKNLEVEDEIIFYQSLTSKDKKELIIEFIKARIL